MPHHTRTPLHAPQVERAIQDKQSAIVRAQGEAQSARLIGQAIHNNPAFLTLRKIEVRLGLKARFKGAGFRGFRLVGGAGWCPHLPHANICSPSRPTPVTHTPTGRARNRWHHFSERQPRVPQRRQLAAQLGRAHSTAKVGTHTCAVSLALNDSGGACAAVLFLQHHSSSSVRSGEQELMWGVAGCCGHARRFVSGCWHLVVMVGNSPELI
jgi:hypothetical protein